MQRTFLSQIHLKRKRAEEEALRLEKMKEEIENERRRLEEEAQNERIEKEEYERRAAAAKEEAEKRAAEIEEKQKEAERLQQELIDSQKREEEQKQEFLKIISTPPAAMVHTDETEEESNQHGTDLEAGENDNRELEYTSQADKNDRLKSQLAVSHFVYQLNFACGLVSHATSFYALIFPVYI